MDKILKKLIFFGGIIFLWVLLFKLNISENNIPSPFAVLETFVNGIKDRTYIISVLFSIRRVMIGFSIALIIGIPLGIIGGKFKILDETVGPMLIGMQSLPNAAWVPLAILWFGKNDNAVVFVVVLGVVFSVALSIIDGVKNVNPLYIQIARTMGAREWILFYDVILPAAIPSIISGIKLSWSFAWRALLAGELLAGGAGLGQILMFGQKSNNIPQVMSVMIITALVGYSVDQFIFKKIEKNIRHKWGLEK